MKRFAFLFSLILMFAPCLISGAPVPGQAFPSFQEITARLWSIYEVPDPDYPEELVFMKKPDGYHVVIRRVTPESTDIISDDLFWSASDHAYQECGFKKREPGHAAEVPESFRDHWLCQLFNSCPYYNYKGWAMDVVKEFDGKGLDFPDSTLYGLARAFGEVRKNFLGNQYGTGLDSLDWHLKIGGNAFSKEQLEIQWETYRMELGYFKKVEAIHPEFETIVGGISLKRANTQMDFFLDMLIWQNEAEAMRVIRDVSYPAFTLSCARNLLMSCPDKALLFTNGDSDTYPLLYLQASEGFRKDVRVINISLLNMPVYFSMLQRPFLGEPGLEFQFEPEQFSDKVRPYFPIDGSSRIKLDVLIAYLADDRNLVEDSPYSLVSIPCKEIEIKKKGKPFIAPLSGRYMLVADVLKLDLLNRYLKERDFCFANTMAHSAFKELKTAMAGEGMIYRFTGKAMPDPGELPVWHDVTKSLRLMEDFTFAPPQPWNESAVGVLNRRQFCINLAWRMKEEKREGFLKVLEDCEALIPDEMAAYGTDFIFPISLYYEAGEKEKARSVAEKVMNNLEAYKAGTRRFYSLWDYETTLSWMHQVIAKTDMTDLMQRLAMLEK